MIEYEAILALGIIQGVITASYDFNDPNRCKESKMLQNSLSFLQDLFLNTKALKEHADSIRQSALEQWQNKEPIFNVLLGKESQAWESLNFIDILKQAEIRNVYVSLTFMVTNKSWKLLAHNNQCDTINEWNEKNLKSVVKHLKNYIMSMPD